MSDSISLDEGEYIAEVVFTVPQKRYVKIMKGETLQDVAEKMKTSFEDSGIYVKGLNHPSQEEFNTLNPKLLGVRKMSDEESGELIVTWQQQKDEQEASNKT